MALIETKTKVDLRNEIARRLGLFSIGIGVEVEDADRIEDAIDLGLIELVRLDAINFDITDDSAIEAYLINSLAQYISPSLLGEHPVDKENYRKIVNEGGDVAIAKITKLVAEKYTPKTSPATYM